MTGQDEAVTPHNLDAERAVLGAFLVNAEAIDTAIALGLTPAEFFRDAHQRIARAAMALRRAGSPVDLVTVADQLQRAGDLDGAGGPAYVAALLEGVPRSTHVNGYARIVIRDARNRRGEAAARQFLLHLQETGVDDALPAATSLLERLESERVETQEPLLEPVSTIVERGAEAAVPYLVEDLIFQGCVSLFFGAERTFKSLATRQVAVDVALRRPVFGLGRLKVREAVPVVIVTEEDSAAAIGEHLNAFSDGAAARRELPVYVSACRGISLDDVRVQDRLLREFLMCSPGLVIFEPLRSLTACVDQGPRELQPFTSFVRRVIRETGAAVLLGHHAVKSVAGHDGRRGNQRVSGGGLLSISEAPVEFVRDDEQSVTITPRGFKHAATPPPLSLRLETDRGRVRRLRALEYCPPPDARETATEAVLEVVRSSPGLSSNAVAIRAKGRKADVIAALSQLAAQGALRAEQDGRGNKWFPSGI